MADYYNMHKLCRVCLEEGALTSIYSTEFAMMPSMMMMMCAKIKVYKTDGLPAVICNNCIYRLGVAYHFKQECENSDIRLRQYLGILDRGYGHCDAETNTDPEEQELKRSYLDDEKDDGGSDDDDEKVEIKSKASKNRKSRYQRKAPEEYKKRGPKPKAISKTQQTCFDCNKTFKCYAQLQMHIRTHTGERPYLCNFCPRRFAQKYNLQIHERTHTGEKPFQCEICSKQFSALGNFQAHQKIHKGIRDQICLVCNKAFYSSGDLSKHMVIHTGIKNHHCDICGKTFGRNRDMVSHKKKIHLNENSSENFKCPECHKVFASSSSLSFHFRTHGNCALPLSQLDHHLQASSCGPANNLTNLVSASQPIAPTAIGWSMSSVPTASSVAAICPPMTMMPPPGTLMLPPLSAQSSLSMVHPSQRIPYQNFT